MIAPTLAPPTAEIADRSSLKQAYSALKSRARRSLVYPPNWVPSLQAARVLLREYGHVRSVASRSAVDAGGNPLPWYTYPAIDFLTQLDFRDRSIFEFGSGMSTLFWARVARKVASVEDNEEWFGRVSKGLPANARLRFEPDVRRFAEAVVEAGEKFDVIVVDGPARGRTRLRCCRAAVDALAEGGLIILDNSDWLPESSQFLRERNFLQVDMTGFAPICPHVQTTSLFFDRAFRMQPLNERMPTPGRGARPHDWEKAPPLVSGESITCDGEPFRDVRSRRAVRFGTPDDAARAFEGFTYLSGDGSRYITLTQPAIDRVLLSKYSPPGENSEPELRRELDRLGSLTWEAFCAFVRDSPLRRYLIGR